MVIALHDKIFDALADGSMTLKELYEKMPEENRVSVRSIICQRPELFVCFMGMVGRKGRDDWIVKDKKRVFGKRRV